MPDFGPLIKTKPLGKILVEKGLLTQQQLQSALEIQKNTKQRLGEVLVSYNFINEEQLYEILAEQKNVPFLKFSDINIKNVDTNLFVFIPKDIAEKYLVFPIEKSENTLILAMKDPFDIFVIDTIESIVNLKVSPVWMTEKDIKEAINKFYQEILISAEETISEEEREQVGETEYKETDAPVIKYVDNLLKQAISTKASDIHVEPLDKYGIIRIREDGILSEVDKVEKNFYPAVVSRIKVLSNLDIAERRLPQDGKFRIKTKDKNIDVRVSTLPTIYGEKVVMRILDKSNLLLNIEDLGFTSQEVKIYKEALSKSYGMILVTGPTGSGKTTTLYSGLNYINTPDKNITTVEDPVEYELKGINQVNVKPQIGLTFANILRSILRQDPDIILVGEIRDKETAEIAIHAALTGHLVLSTLHTNDATSSISRLVHMGIEPILISSSLVLIMAQRLVRCICQNCKQEEKVDSSVISFLEKKLGISIDKNTKFYKGKGCDICKKTGYKGRSVVCEMLKLDEEIKYMIVENKSEIEIKEKAISNGMMTLQQSAFQKAKLGITTLDEVIKLMII